jgi:hypothetical protein
MANFVYLPGEGSSLNLDRLVLIDFYIAPTNPEPQFAATIYVAEDMDNIELQGNDAEILAAKLEEISGLKVDEIKESTFHKFRLEE